MVGRSTPPLLGPRIASSRLTACVNASGERPPHGGCWRTLLRPVRLTALDAAQAVAHEAITLQALQCDSLPSRLQCTGPMASSVLAGRRTPLNASPMPAAATLWFASDRDEAEFAELPMRLEGGIIA